MTDHPEPLDLIWKVANIATFIGRTERQTWEALNKGELPARQVNGRWCASRSRLTAFLTGMGIDEAEGSSAVPDAPLAVSDGVKRQPKPRRATATIHKLQPRKGRAA
jgi:hypothetical protein